MRLIRIIAAIMVFAITAFIASCSEEKTASLEGHEDIVAVIQRLPECLDNPALVEEIYTENAILNYQDGQTGRMITLTGSKEIENYRKDRGKAYKWIKVSISDIKKEVDKAHVEYQINSLDVKSNLEWKITCSAEMVKQGQTWKITQETDKVF